MTSDSERKSLRGQTRKEVDKLSTAPLSIDLTKPLDSLKARVVTPTSFDRVDEFGYVIISFLFFSGMAYLFFSLSQSEIAYVWIALAIIMLFVLSYQIYSLIADIRHERRKSKDT